MFNLLKESWIPVIDQDGKIHKISCAEISDARWVDLAPPRADFRGALYEFLIGLLQTTATPEGKGDWRKWMGNPPTIDELQRKFDPIQSAFNLDGEGFRFLQDASVELSGTKRISQLLLEAPGDQTLKHNKDFFLKRPEKDAFFSYPMIAMALITRAQYDPGFGGGFRGALRGPGALVTLVKAKALWQTLWLNVLTKDKIRGEDLSIPADLSKLFPWMGPCRTSEKGELPVTAGEVHPLVGFWGTPNRIRIDFQGGLEEHCTISGTAINKGASSLHAQRYGTNYEGRFFHPLSPFTFKPEDDNAFYFSRGKQLSGRGGTFRSWVGVAIPYPSRNLTPAPVIQAAQERDRKKYDVGLWTFGFSLRQALALAWNELEFPMIDLEGVDHQKLANFATALIHSTDLASMNLRQAIQRAMYEKNVDGKWESGSTSISGKTFWEQSEANFWQSLNDTFFDAIRKYIDGEEERKLCEGWLGNLQFSIQKEFDHVVWSGDSRAVDPKSASVARNEMWLFTSAYSKKIREILDLPKPEKKSA